MPKLYTIGHSSHSLPEFLRILRAYNITDLMDIRTIPKSRYVPWFNQNSLKAALRKEKISYTHMASLGGLRKAAKNSLNQGWRNASFRGFADYMQTPSFYMALKNLNQRLKPGKRVVIMCAEAVPWRCHRLLIADAEIVRRITVLHIMSSTTLQPHTLTSFAIINHSKRPIKIYYPANSSNVK